MTVNNKYSLAKYETMKYFDKVNKRSNLKYLADEYIKLMLKYTMNNVPMFFFAVCVDGFLETGIITVEDKYKFLFALLDNEYEEFANIIKVQLTDIEITKATAE